jgi:G3E family GTPase
MATIHTAVHGVVSEEPLRVAEPPGAVLREPGPAQDGAATHTDDVSSLVLRAERPVDWLGFAVWLSMLLHARGQQVLRVKGLLELDEGTMVSVNGVQHVVHPPEHLDAGAIPEARSDLVFITRGIEIDRLRESFEVFQRLARATARLNTG